MPRRRMPVLAASLLSAALVAAACGGATPPVSPQQPAASDAPPSIPPAAASDGGPDGIALMEFAESGDPAAAGRRELELVRELREDAGMSALMGPNGAAAFAGLDAIAAAYGQGLLEAVSIAADTGDFSTAAADPLAGLVASRDAAAAPTRVAPGTIDVSLFADTGFTANAILTVAAGVVQRAAESRNGSLPRQEHFDQESDGLRQAVDLNTTITVSTGGGKVSVDITMSATDSISTAPGGSFIARYTSTTTGHFDVDACPDRDGIANGTYAFETKHELNDVSSSTAARSGAGRRVSAPFSLVNGDDAHLVRIEAALDLQADAQGPGSAGGPGPTAPFDWSAAQQVSVVIPARGGTTASGGDASVTGTGGGRAGGALLMSSAMAQLFLMEVAKEAERFWRSGKCIDLKPNEDSRNVDANEAIDLTVEALEAFGGGTIEAPITATFSGEETLDPSGQPVDAPATFHFVAGADRDDRGTIDLKQTSKRGIGLRQVVYTVVPQALEVRIDGTVQLAGGLTSYDVTLRLKPLALEPAGDGSFRGRGRVTWETVIHPGVPQCETKRYDGSFETEITVKSDPEDPDRFIVEPSVNAGQPRTETIRCGGVSIPFAASTFLGGWAAMAARRPAVELGGDGRGSATVEVPVPGGSARTTITLRRLSGGS